MKKAHFLLSIAFALFTLTGLAQGQVVSQNMKALARSGTALVGLSGADGTLKRSTDGGVNFSTVFTPSGATLQNVVASGTTVIAVGSSGYIVRSTDGGVTFATLSTGAAPSTLGFLYDAASSNGTLWVAVGKSATNKVAAAYSTDGGANWLSGSVPNTTGELRAVVYDSGAARWSAVGTDLFGGAALYTSTDGQNWSAVTVPTLAATLNDVASNGAGNLLAVGDSGTLLVSSNGGAAWAFEANSGAVSPQILYAVVYSSATTSFTAGGQELVQITYTVAGGSVVAQQPIPSSGDITTLITSAAGAVITGGGLSGYQTITFAGPGNQLMTASPVTLSATASSGLAVSFRVISGAASVSGTQLTLTGAGSVTVEAYQNGGTNSGITYTPAVSVQRTFTVTQASATVTLGSLAATYDGTAKSASAATAPSGLNVVLTYDGSTTAPTNAGSYAVVATINETAYTGSASGTLTIAKASQTITFTGPGDQTLGGSPIALSASTTSSLPITYTLDSGPATLTGNTLTLTNTGTVTVTASQGGNSNYNAASSVQISFTVTAQAATVTLGSLAATYDGTPKSATATTLPAGLNVTFTYDGSATAPTNAGSYAVVATVADTTYAGTASGTLVIGKANQTISFTAPSDRAFTFSNVALSATATSGLSVSFAVVSGPATVSGTSLTLTGAGTINLEASQAGNANYNAAPNVNRSFAVSANFDSWRAAYFNSTELADLNISGPNAIVSGDGLTNLLKYALGLDPRVAASSGLPEANSTATDWVYTYTRPTSTSDLTYEVEASADLVTWSTAGVTHQQASTSGGTATWTATVAKSTAPTKLFFRLKITRGTAP